MAGAATNEFMVAYPFENICSLCSNSFISKPLLLNHLKEVHLVAPILECSHCHRRYPGDKLSTVSSHYSRCRRIGVPASASLSVTNTQPSLEFGTIQPILDNLSGVYHDQNTMVQSQESGQTEFKCQYCTYQCRTKSGLGQHKRHRHAQQWSDENVVTITRARWSQDELVFLARKELQHEKDPKGKDLLDFLKSSLPARSLDGIRGARRAESYRVTLQNERTADLQANTVRDASRNASSEELLFPVPVLDQWNIEPVLVDALSSTPMDDQTFRLIIQKFIGQYPKPTVTRGVYQSKRTADVKKREETLTRLKGKKIKQFLYAEHQRLFKKSPKVFYNSLKSEKQKGEISLQQIHEIFDPILGSPSFSPDEGCEKNSRGTDMQPTVIREAEVLCAIKSSKSESAPGLDGVKLKEIKEIPVTILTAIYNNWLKFSSIPSELIKCRTTFIPKNVEILTPSDVRPITMASIFYRLFTRVLVGHFEKLYNFDKHQAGFVKDGNVNINLLQIQALMKVFKSKKKSLFLCTIDISKAFDSVSHVSILSALRDAGFPEIYVRIVENSYFQVNTEFSYEGVTDSVKVNIKRGIKQGDPMSPFLFNLVLNPMIIDLNKQYGARICGGTILSALAYADDLILISETKIGLQSLLDSALAFLRAHKLKINITKCDYFGYMHQGKQRRFNYNLPRLNIDNENKYCNPILKPVTYLGVKLFPHKPSQFNLPWLEKELQVIGKAYLKPRQKLHILKVMLLPKVYFALGSLLLPKVAAERVSKIVRKTVKQWFHLPPGFPNALLLSNWKSGGLGLNDIFKTTARIFCTNVLRTMRVCGPAAEILLSDSCLKKVITNMFQVVGIPAVAGDTDTVRKVSQEKENRYLDNLFNSYENKSLKLFRDHPVENAFLQENSNLMSSENQIKTLKMRANLLPVKSVTNRHARLEKDRMCRRCGASEETLHHVLQVCQSVISERIRRHDYITRKAVKIMKSVMPNSSCELEELHVDSNNNRLRPDATIRSGEEVVLLETAVTWEGSLSRVYQAKRSKYESLIRTLRSSGKKVSLLVICMSARGIMADDSHRLLMKHGFRKREIGRLAADVSVGSLTIFNRFMAI